MKYTKETFLEHLDSLRILKNSKGGLNDYGEGRLALAEQVENLIIYSSSLHLPTEEKIISEIRNSVDANIQKAIETYLSTQQTLSKSEGVVDIKFSLGKR